VGHVRALPGIAFGSQVAGVFSQALARASISSSFTRFPS
jgi:hypothetical protein